jgi:hypothetical protein
MNARTLLLAAALAEQLDIAAVPEPETWALLAGGLVVVAGRRKAARLRR